ncbi:MAG: DUF1552 domain-containing protein [Myxococcota bacterium]
MKTSRRHFLRGVGGFTLSIPFLPSITGRRAFADSSGGGPFFVAFATHHGGVWGHSMFPDEGLLSEQGRYAGRVIRGGALSGEVSGGRRRLSSVLDADSGRLTERLVGQMNVIRGLDVPWYIAHHTGGHLGNFARNDANGGDGLRMQAYPTPTIDQILAHSDRFYPDPDAIVERAMVIGARGLSYNYANPTDPRSDIQRMHNITSSVALFDRVFRPASAFGAASPLVVDRVIESYRTLLSNPRLSSGDQRRLDAHMERLFDVERRLNLELTCEIESPAFDAESLWEAPDYFRDPGSQARYWQLMNDIVVAAFSCGVSRIATMHVVDTLSNFAGDWHQDIAHQAYAQDNAQQTLRRAHQQFFEDIYLDLIEKLDATAGPSGGSILDDALVVWTQESGQYTHESYSIPVVTAGSACGALRTGQYVDYRDLDMELPFEEGPSHGYPSDHPGLTWNQYLGTVLQVMGLSSEGGLDLASGYGPMFVSPERPYYDEAVTVAGEPLPLLV